MFINKGLCLFSSIILYENSSYLFSFFAKSVWVPQHCQLFFHHEAVFKHNYVPVVRAMMSAIWAEINHLSSLVGECNTKLSLFYAVPCWYVQAWRLPSRERLAYLVTLSFLPRALKHLNHTVWTFVVKFELWLFYCNFIHMYKKKYRKHEYNRHKHTKMIIAFKTELVYITYSFNKVKINVKLNLALILLKMFCWFFLLYIVILTILNLCVTSVTYM